MRGLGPVALVTLSRFSLFFRFCFLRLPPGPAISRQVRPAEHRPRCLDTARAAFHFFFVLASIRTAFFLIDPSSIDCSLLPAAPGLPVNLLPRVTRRQTDTTHDAGRQLLGGKKEGEISGEGIGQ